MRSILTVLLTGLLLLNCFAQDEVEFTVLKKKSLQPSRYFYETSCSQQCDTVIDGYFTPRESLHTYLEWVKTVRRQDTAKFGTSSEFTLTFGTRGDTVLVDYTKQQTESSQLCPYYLMKAGTSLKSTFSFPFVFTKRAQQTQTSVLLDTLEHITIDTAIYKCFLVVLSRDTTVDFYKRDGPRAKSVKRAAKIYTYCYLSKCGESIPEYLPIMIIETRPTSDAAYKEVPAWLVNRYWRLKYHT